MATHTRQPRNRLWRIPLNVTPCRLMPAGRPAGSPMPDAASRWQPTSEETIMTFSAVWDYLGRENHSAWNVLAGLIGPDAGRHQDQARDADCRFRSVDRPGRMSDYALVVDTSLREQLSARASEDRHPRAPHVPSASPSARRRVPRSGVIQEGRSRSCRNSPAHLGKLEPLRKRRLLPRWLT